MVNKKPPPEKNWTEQEQWVWKKLCAGEAADFNNSGNPKKKNYMAKTSTPEMISSGILKTKTQKTESFPLNF